MSHNFSRFQHQAQDRGGPKEARRCCTDCVSDIISSPSFEAAYYTMDSMTIPMCYLELIIFNLQ